MSATTVALWALGLVALMWALRWVMTAHQLLRIRLRPWHQTVIAEDAISDEMRRFLDPPSAELIALGFEPIGTVAMHGMVVAGDAPPNIYRVLFFAPTYTFAYVGPSEVLQAPKLHSISFRTLLADKRWLLGTNGEDWSRVADTHQTELHDPYAPTTAAHWSAYRARLEHLASAGNPPVPVPDLIAGVNASGADFIAELVALGAAEPASDGQHHQLRFAQAFRISTQVLRESSKLRKLLLDMRQARALERFAEVPIELEVAAFKRSEASRVAGSRRGGVLYFVLAVLATVALGIFGVIAPVTLAMVVAVVVFHELGHYAAMRAFGYGDTTIFLIPFFGGAAVGNKARIALHEEMIVLLAGPLPGIIAAMAFAYLAPELTSTGWPRELVMMSCIINMLNLLPIFPLDGGKIVDGLLARKRPYLLAAFRVLAIALFAAIAIATGDFTSIVLAAITALSLSSSMRTARLERAVLSNRTADEAGDPLRMIFERMRALNIGAIAQPQKILIARQVLQRIDRAPQGTGATLGWACAYGGSLIAGIFGSLFAISPSIPEDALSLFTSTDSTLESSLDCTQSDEEIFVAQTSSMSTFALECDARSRKTVRRLEEELSIFALPAASAYPIRPPWIGTAETAQAKTRHTARVVWRAQKNERSRAGVRRVIAEHPELDAEFAEQLLDAKTPEDQERIARALGILEVEDEEDGSAVRPAKDAAETAVHYLRPRAHGRTLSIDYAVFWKPETAMPRLIRHLCEQGCQTVRWGELEPP